MKTGKVRSLRLPRSRFRPALELLEDRCLLSAWSNFGHDPQHTGISFTAAQPIDAIHWQTPVDLNPTGAAVHYGSPVITPGNTVIVPVKTGSSGGFQLSAFDGATGSAKWTFASDYTLPPFSWMPPFGPALAPGSRLYYAGNGGTVYYINNPDGPARVSGQLAFYGIANYNANPAAYNSTVMIDTPITADNAGNIYFGFEVTGPNPSHLVGGGIARIDASGNGSWVLAHTAANDSSMNKVPLAAAPALSNDGTTLYVSVNNNSSSYGYLLALDSTTLATKDKVFLKDPRNGNANNARLIDQSTATPMVAHDGTVFYGIFGNPYNGSRGFLLHFSADLSTEYTPGAFGWDDTPSLVPASMVPSYHGTSPYLIFLKYNNYVAGETGGTGGDGVNQIAILDPYASQPDVRNDGDSSLQVMNEVMTIAGPTPDTYWVNHGYPNAVREWCINDTAVDVANKSILVNSEDGNVYRWDLTTNTLTQAVMVTLGVGEPYTPTSIGPDGTVYAINGGTLFALGGLTGYTLTDLPSVNPVAVGQSVTFTATLASTNGGATPTGTVTFMDDTTTLATVTVVNGQASYTTSSLALGNHCIMAGYSGDASYAAGSTTLVESVRYGETTSLTSSANPSVFGQAVTLTATVTSTTSGTPTPTGKVVFLDGSTLLGSVNLSSGQATLTLSNLSAATHSITASYNGDIFYVPGASSVLSQTVNRDSTTTTLVSSANPSTFGQAVTFTATVTANSPGSGVPTGTVYFTDNGARLGSATLDANGNASFTTSTLSIGQHNIRAWYGASSQYTSSSAVLVQAVAGMSPVILVASNGSSTNWSNNSAAGESITASVARLTNGWDGLGQQAAALARPAAIEGLALTLAKTAASTPADLDAFFASLEKGLA